jgi:hypothetical protein
MSCANFRGWDEPMSREEQMSFLAEVAVASACGPYSDYLLELFEAGKFRELIEYEVPFETSLDDFRAAVQIQGLIKKNPWIPLGYDPEREAFDAFFKAELQCEETNFRLEHARPIGDVLKVFHRAGWQIERVLGGVPPLSSLGFRFGPGANTSISRAQASLSAKLSATLACSKDLLPYLGIFLQEVPNWVQEHCEKSHSLLPLWEADPLYFRQRVAVRVDDGKLVFVPKNAKTHRPIVVEPILNGFFQLGVGSYLKDRILRFAGQDLTDQEHNRRLAREGSVTGRLTTIDLSSASDTLAFGCVSSLLPPEWVEFLGSLRTGTVSYHGVSLPLEKFSSMGNGYTFELESLIFWALAEAATYIVGGDARNIGIFGDDIVVPIEATTLLRESLDWFGFTVNTKKSYWSGPFRESCGADWLAGNDVRPFFIKEEVSDQYLYVFHNWMMRRGERKLASIAKSFTVEPNRLYGPDGYGDGHLLGSHRLYLPRSERRSGYAGGFFDTYALKAKRTQRRRPGDWLVPGYTVYRRSGAESPTDPSVLPGSSGYVRRSIYTFSQSIFCG